MRDAPNHVPPRGERGQAIVPMVFTATALGLALFTTVSVWQAVRSKIGLQLAADAAAYSTGVTEARCFNFFAMSNRAMASHYVATLLMYGELSYVSAFDSALDDAADGFADAEGEMDDLCKTKGECCDAVGGGVGT